TWVKEDGQHLIFPRCGEGWNRAELHALWLTRENTADLPVSLPTDAAQVLVVRDNAGAWWAFSSTGDWLAHSVGAGDVLTVNRDEQGQIVALQHARGRCIGIEYAAGRVAYAQSNDGTRMEYLYDREGRLTGARSPLGPRVYDYNEQGLISAVRAADGTVEVENFYDALGRVRSQNYPHGVTRRYSYLAGGVTLVTNEDGSHANSWVSDAKGRLVGMIDAHQRRQTMAYDTFNNRVSVTERDGAMTVRAYTKRGLLAREVSPEGADTTYEYDAHDRLITLMTANGAVVSYEYADATGVERNPSVLVDALGGRTEMVWEGGLLTSMVGPTGVSATCSYNSYGEMTAVSNAAGDVTSFVRDATGRIERIVSPLGLITRFTYDAAGLLVSREDADGAVWRFGYGPGGRLTSVTDPAGARTTYEYNAAGEVAKTIDPLGRVSTRGFDSMGNLVSVTGADGARWALEYDQLMQNTAVIDPLGHRWSREFDTNGELAAVVDPTGVRVSTAYQRRSGLVQVKDAFGTHTTSFDAYGRPVKETAADGSEEIYTYDAAGNVVEILDAEGGLTLIARDGRGEVTSVTSPEGRVTSFTYDACGRPSTMREPTGVTTTLEYDADSRVITRSTTSGVREEITYDAASRPVVVRTNTGVSRYGYDACGRLVFAVDRKFGTRRFVYDAAGQLVTAINGLGGKTRYTYTAAGLVASVTDPRGESTFFEYDAAGQLMCRTDALGRKTTTSYDAAGRLVSSVSPDADVLSYTYDAAGSLATTRFNQQLICRVERDAAARTTTVFDYTDLGVGLIDEQTGAPVVHTLVYDRVGRLVRQSVAGSLAGAGHESVMTYDRDGLRTSLCVDGVSTEYVYEPGTGLLSSVVRSAADGGVVEGLEYHYDGHGQLVRISDANGQVLRAFDVVPTVVQGQASDAGDTASSDAADKAATSATTSYVTDGGWATIDVRTTDDGEQTTTTTYYSPQGLVVGVDDSVDGLRLFTYDEAHQLTAVRSAAGVHSFVYDQAGFLIKESTADGVVREFTYDGAGQLVGLADSALGVSELVYDGLGRRVRWVAGNGAVTEFAYSPVGLLAEVSTQAGADADAGAGQVVRLWNDALGRVAGAQGAGVPADQGAGVCSVVWDPMADTPTVSALGGVPVSLASSVAQDVLGSRGVDPFGVSPVVGASPVSAASSSSVAPGFGVTVAGSLQVAGLEVLGARAYDPGVRGFISPDPVVSPVGAGWGSNVYAFVGNDPVGLVDPWGLSPLTASEFREYRADVRGRAVERAGKGLADFARDNAGWIALGVAAVGVAAAVVSGPIGWSILAGMAISGGIELGSQLISGDGLDWRKIATSASIGGIAGGLGAGVAGAVTKIGSKVFSSVASRFTARAGGVGKQISQVFRKVATNPATKNSVPRMVSGLKQTQIGLQRQAARYSSWASRVGSVGVREGVEAYVEAGVDTSLTYITDGHRVTGSGLVSAWGVPALSNVLSPIGSRKVNAKLQDLGWGATSGLSQKIQERGVSAVGDFVNGVVSYSGAPSTYSPQYESYRDGEYEGPGWSAKDAGIAGLKQAVSGGVSSSSPVESLKSVSFDPSAGSGAVLVDEVTEDSGE
ncbi:RHS repeat-associated core domain-containing protein, partial [Rothia nasisuis]